MELGDIESKKLLPRFAHDSKWVQLAFDVIVKNVYGRSKSIDAPLTLEAIQSLTDEELQALYEQFGIVKYYPDLSRETRDKMLFEMCQMYRYLGTPKAIETLCNYIFDGVELDITVNDNQAFNESGNLVRPDLLDTFDAVIGPQVPVLDESANARILENIINFSRNSQYLNGICYDFNEDLDLSVSFALDDDNPVCTVDILNEAICDPVGPPPPPPPPEPSYSYIVFDISTGTIVHSIVDEGMVYGDVGYALMDEAAQMITVYETGVRVESFYFTTNGRNETENTDLSHVDIPVYFEDGTSPAADTPYDGSSVLAFMDVDGNTKQANGESLYVDDGVLKLDATETEEGEQWAALAERFFTLSFANTQLPGITITLPANETGTSGTTVTLPTMSGEYESGGKTWSPTAWDIGAFGSTYTINLDVTAHLIFEEVVVPMPTVYSMTGRLGNSSSSSGDSTTNFAILSSGRKWFFKLENGSYSMAIVDSGTVLAVAKINNTSNEPQYYGFTARRVASDGTVRLMNNTYATYNNANSVDVYYCVDSNVGIATVTNGNGDKFWAFKYISDGVAYYFVLDLSSGSLPSESWVSDLSSLGYTLFNATLYYFASPKEPISIGGNNYSNLLLDNGNYLSYNSSKNYRIINAYTSETDSIGIGCESFWVSSSMSLATLYNSDVAHAFYSVEIVIT